MSVFGQNPRRNRRQGENTQAPDTTKIQAPDSTAVKDTVPVLDSLTLRRDSIRQAKADSLDLLSKSSISKPAFSAAKDSSKQVFADGQRKMFYWGDVKVSYENISLEADYSNDLQVNRTTPRAFIALSDDDKAVPAANGFSYYEQLYKHDVPASIHIYPSGGHGWGYRESFTYHYQMIFELKGWLESF